ncbi:MAG: isoprenyl transferase [Acidobacteriota bacterium]|jgi:undecaprenyl diphosphate synthase|nr:isoprenyl transferase [Acidobacteriota bacterium]NLT33183.1 isoprenyl transferase [Acidobacteriota bacterium]
MEMEGFAPSGSREAELLQKIDESRLPRHLAVIMDGNGRWAGSRSLPRVAGHRAGIESVREIVESSARLGMEALTLYAFSVENWKRPRSEVRTLMALLKKYLRQELGQIHANNIRFLAIGRIRELEASVREELRHAMRVTAKNTGMHLYVALNYSGRAEIVDAFNLLLRERRKNGDTAPVDEEAIARRLYTSAVPDPDLLIRTSGEMRISNFLLWQIAYSEIYITPTYWPDFRRLHLLEAILEYQKRDRRYGGIQAPCEGKP